MSKAATHRITRPKTRLSERVNAICEHVYNECLPPDHEIRRFGINEIKRWRLILSPDKFRQLFNKLTPQQKKGVPNYPSNP